MRSPVRLCLADAVVFTLVAGSVVTVVTAATASKREIMHRIKCASNLKQLGTAILLYANENRGAYPRTTTKAGDPPVWGTPYADDAKPSVASNECDPFADEKTAPKAVLDLKPKPNDVTAAMYLLLRTEDLVPEVFVCPSTRAKRFDYDGKGASALSYTNFIGKQALAANLSYSYQNPYASKDAIKAGFKLNNSITAEFAVMADMNPGGDAVKSVKATSSAKDMRPANSLNHRGNGENVLFGDGHIEYLTNPFVGVQRDNIYTANGPDAALRPGSKAEIVASPADADDSILLPTAADIDQKPYESGPVTPGDAAALQKPLVGTFGGRIEGVPATLTVTDTQLKMASGPSTFVVDYKVLGTRGDATVIELSGEGLETTQADVTKTAETITINADFDELANSWVRRR